MLTVFIYSLIGLAVILFLGRNQPLRIRLLLGLVAMILLNAPTLLALLFHA
jgi:hypothetical protein